ncbi:c-type cytochrome [Oligoflexus tunisiensis]|uniref:c-type cytochrome n=1 Tax=Oligoflexus tunisiensis TaxID=708132 RepID=UPI00114CF424|nr:cytochrome c [Oligoflexus tunisiensis]
MRLAWIIPVCLSLQLMSCTKKKPTESAPAPAEASPAAATPQDATHANFPLTARPSGEIRNDWVPTPQEKAQLDVLEQEAKKFAGLKNQADKARALFKLHCATCHGAEGRGDGPGGDSLPVIPTNFHEWPIKYGRAPHEVAFTIINGRNEEVMPPFGAVLKKEELWSLVWLVTTWIEARPDNKKP